MDHQTVSAASILCMAVSLLICFGLPIGLAIWGKVHYKKAFSFLPLLGGFLGFFVSQILFRIPVLQYLFPALGWDVALRSEPWLDAIFLAVTAGLVEEFARFLVFLVMKKRRGFPDGLSYGIGHGGTEAMLLVGLTYVNNIVYSVMINSGAWGPMLAALPPAAQDQLGTVAVGLASATPAVFLMGGVERLLTMAIQIALSFVVLKGFVNKKSWFYLPLAILLHALVDFPAALAGLGLLNIGGWAMEGYIFVLAAVSVWFILHEAKAWRNRNTLPQQAVLPQ